jgi:hypothetical protein
MNLGHSYQVLSPLETLESYPAAMSSASGLSVPPALYDLSPRAKAPPEFSALGIIHMGVSFWQALRNYRALKQKTWLIHRSAWNWNSRKFAVASQPLSVTGWRIGTGLWPKTVTIVTVLAAFVAGNCCELSQVVTFQLRENFHCYCCATLRRSAPPRCISPFGPVWSLVSAYTTHNTQQSVRTLAGVPGLSGRGYAELRLLGILGSSLPEIAT